MAKFAAIKRGKNLVAVDDDGRDIMRKLSFHKPIMVDVKQKRSVHQHRLYWGLIRKVHDNLPERLDSMWPRPENLSKAILERLGYTDEIYGLDGKVFKQVQSIAFDNMDHTEFSEFMDQAIQLITTVIIPGLNAHDLHEEVLDMVA